MNLNTPILKQKWHWGLRVCIAVLNSDFYESASQNMVVGPARGWCLQMHACGVWVPGTWVRWVICGGFDAPGTCSGLVWGLGVPSQRPTTPVVPVNTRSGQHKLVGTPWGTHPYYRIRDRYRRAFRVAPNDIEADVNIQPFKEC